MKIGIIATHSFPIPYATHTGDIVILDLARSLKEMGHDVSMYAPAGTDFPNLFPMKCSFGKYPPSGEECELECFDKYKDKLRQEDIVHDFSTTKKISQALFNEGKRNIVNTLFGGAWTLPYGPWNLNVPSFAHRERVMRGATDYEGTPTPDLAGPPQKPVKDVSVVYLGVDTDFYCPTYEKKGYFLHMSRHHPVRGYRQAIELAKKTGIELVMAGEHPDNELFEYQRGCALEAIELAKGLPNVHFEFLPKDPDHHIKKLKLLQEAKAMLYMVQFHEPFGLTQVESLACGTPVLATDYGSVPEIITGEVGYFKKTIEEMAPFVNYIRYIDTKKCRKKAVEKFDRKIMAQNFLKEYERVIANV